MLCWSTFVDVSDFDSDDVAVSFERLVELLGFGDVGLVLRVLLVDFSISWIPQVIVVWFLGESID